MKSQYPDVSLPDFSSDNLHRLLTILVEAYEGKGQHVSDSLLPLLSRSELVKRCNWFPGEIPAELFSLYSWRGGQINDAWNSEFPFWFGDMTFSSIERAKPDYESMMETYGCYPEDHELLKYSFPFASFNGGWYVFPTKGQPFSPNLKAPIICVLQGIDIHFYSIETMVATCIDWVNEGIQSDDVPDSEKNENRAWQRHNPGIFGRRI